MKIFSINLIVNYESNSMELNFNFSLREKSTGRPSESSCFQVQKEKAHLEFQEKSLMRRKQCRQWEK